jgi:hypothetical protein
VLLSVLVLSFVLVLVPARRARQSATARGTPAVVFFASVGLAYLLVEVWLIHRFGTYLGHQTYAFGVVLLTLLLGSGFGARWGERWFSSDRARAVVSALSVAAALGIASLALGRLLEATMSSPLAARMAIATLVTTMLGVAMGQPFPSGLRWARVGAPNATPWYVAINGFSSVIATLLVVPLSIAGGYRVVLAAGALLYVAAALSASTFHPAKKT